MSSAARGPVAPKPSVTPLATVVAIALPLLAAACGQGANSAEACAAGSLSTACAAQFASSDLTADGGISPPPASGTFAYNAFSLPATAGASYTDPVFGSTVKRLTTDHSHDDIYARNMWWSADDTRYLHRNMQSPLGDSLEVIDAATGAVLYAGIPLGTVGADDGFDPANANQLYYYSGSSIHQVTLGANKTFTDAVYFTAPATIDGLGGTLNWMDASGRYMLVRYGAEPSVHLYDRQNLAAGPFANAVDGAKTIDSGSYVGLTPDGKFIVGYESAAGTGFGGNGQGVSWAVNPATRAVAAAPNVFWSLCGDHGTFISPSDGRDYMIVNDCYGAAGLWRVDVTNNAAGLNEPQQQQLPNNKLLLAYASWNDFGHYSAAAKGANRDWAFASTENALDVVNGAVTGWHAYESEIIGLNVTTGEVRRLAHHRCRRPAVSDYYQTPRMSAAWGGSFVAFASNFDLDGTTDIYAIPFSGSSTGATGSPGATGSTGSTGSTGATGTSGPAAQSVVWTSLVNAAVLPADASSLKKSGGCDGCQDSGALSQQRLVSGDGYVEFTASDAATNRALGWSSAPSGTGSASIQFAFMLWAGGNLEVRESGVYKASATYALNDVLRVSVESGAVNYYKNGALLYTSAATPAYPLTADASLWSASATLGSAKIALGTQAVTWASVTHALTFGAGAASLAKSGGCDGCQDSGAVSAQSFASSHGGVQFTASDTTTNRALGLTRTTSTGTATIQFAVMLWSGGNYEIREYGVYMAGSTYSVNDVFTLRIESDRVKYYRNGALFYASAVAPSYPLSVDASLWSAGATLGNIYLLP